MNTKFAIDFIPSQDERDFLKVRDHEPTLFQAALFIVSGSCKIPFKKQEEALLKLKETNEDEPYEDTTVFKLIDDYIEKSHRTVLELEDRKDTTYYTYSYDDEIVSSRSFKTFEDCKVAALEEFEKPYNEFLEYIRIEKNDFDDEDYYCSAVFCKDENGDLQYLYMRNFGPLLMAADDVSIPYPFRVGDMVKRGNSIEVLYELPSETNKYVGKTLSLAQNHNVILMDFCGSLFTYEYCKVTYGKYKILDPIARYLRGEMYIDDMLNLYEKARQNELCKAPYYSYFEKDED